MFHCFFSFCRFDGCEASCNNIAVVRKDYLLFNRPLDTVNEHEDAVIAVQLWLNKFRGGGQLKVRKEDVLAYCQKEFPPYLVTVDLHYYMKLHMLKRNVIWTRLLIALENLKNEQFINVYSACKINIHEFIYHANTTLLEERNPDTVTSYERSDM